MLSPQHSQLSTGHALRLTQIPWHTLRLCASHLMRDRPKNFSPQRTLRLCGEISESESAIIGENLRLIRSVLAPIRPLLAVLTF